MEKTDFRKIEGRLMSEFNKNLTTVAFDENSNEQILDNKCCSNVKRLPNGKLIEIAFAWDDDDAYHFIEGDKDQYENLEEFLKTLESNGLYLENVQDMTGCYTFEAYEYKDGYHVTYKSVD